MRTIRVTGKGQIRLRPDLTRITMILDGLWPQYGDAVKHSSEDTEALKEVLESFGFARRDLKTLSFHVEPEYEGYQEENVYKQRLAGYRFRHELKLEFDSYNERLGKIVYALANDCGGTPELRISYTVRDPEAAKKTLLAKAVQDSREKAELLVQAAGSALGELQTIDYSWGQIDLEVRPMNRLQSKMMCARGESSDSYTMDIEPDDIEVSDSVTVVWEIA